MAIKAVIQEVLVDPDQTTVIRVLYTDTSKFNKTAEYRYAFPSFKLDTLKQQIANQLASFPTVIEDPKAVVPLGDFDPGVVQPPVKTPLDQFKADLQVLRDMEKAIAQGFKKSTDADYVTQTATVKTELSDNPEFIKYL